MADDTAIPTYRDLMYPTLIAVRQLGGLAANSELEEAVPQVAAVSDEQLAVEYPEKLLVSWAVEDSQPLALGTHLSHAGDRRWGVEGAGAAGA